MLIRGGAERQNTPGEHLRSYPLFFALCFIFKEELNTFITSNTLNGRTLPIKDS